MKKKAGSQAAKGSVSVSKTGYQDSWAGSHKCAGDCMQHLVQSRGTALRSFGTYKNRRNE
jgi:hypothetical protein